MLTAFAKYLHFLRVAYLTLCDENSRGGFASRAPAHFAGRTIFACVYLHLIAPVLIAIAVTGGIRGLSDTAVLTAFLLPMAAVALWEVAYVERSSALEVIWERLSAEPAAEQLRRKRQVSLFVWGSFVGLFLCSGGLIVRAILDHRASLTHG